MKAVSLLLMVGKVRKCGKEWGTVPTTLSLSSLPSIVESRSGEKVRVNVYIC